MTYAERNAVWETLDPAAKRVWLARDVLAQLAAKKYDACRRVYVDVQFTHEHAWNHVRDEQLHETLERDGVRCLVCALGGLLCSLARVEDRLSTRQVCEARGRDLREILERLEGLFEPKQLTLMEAFFEGADEGYYGDRILEENLDSDDSDDVRPHKDFAGRYKSSEDRLRAIMENVIANNGEFVPA